MQRSRLPGLMIGLLIAVLLIGGIALGGKSKKSKPAGGAKPAASKQQPQTDPQLATFAKATTGARAATVTSDRTSRTVVVPPCDTPVQATVTNAARGIATPGATVLQLPRAHTARTVIVPKCSGTSGQTQTPSAAVVVASALASAKGLKSQITVDGNSRARTIVLPPCAASQSGSSQQPTADDTSSAGGKVLVAPPC